jgi:hypothetical protein
MPEYEHESYDAFIDPVPTIFSEQRFAGRKTHQCHWCSGWIDKRPYTRTAVADSTAHRRSFSWEIVCESCLTPKAYVA